MSKSDFIAPMIQLVDHGLKIDQPKTDEEVEADRIKRWLDRANQFLKVRNDETTVIKKADTP